MLTPVKRTRLSQGAIEQITDLIVNKKLQPGTRLPSERQLMTQLKIGRASVREALRSLEIMGLIEVRPGSGAFVKQEPGDIFLPLPMWLANHKETLDHHFEARLVIEPRAAAFAAQRALARDIQAMKETCAKFERNINSSDLVSSIKTDIEFHRLIAKATKNKTLELLMDTIARFLFEGWKATLRVRGRFEKTVMEHNAILEAIEQKDPEKASQLMESHLRKALADLENIGQEGSQ